MKETTNSAQPSCSSPRRRWILMFAPVFALLILLGLLSLPRRERPAPAAPRLSHTNSGATTEPARVGPDRVFPRLTAAGPAPTAEEIVAGKLAEFTRSRRELARAMAKRKGVSVPSEVEEFFDALASGDWPAIEAGFKALSKRSGQYEGSTNWEALNPVWCAVLDAYGVAEQAHEWPAQKLLDYGHSILDSLRPGMVYVGGTDNGRWVPELLNDTGSDPHIIVTQNALADSRYLDYVRELYGDRFDTLSQDESQRAFQEYSADAQKRLEHDQQSPEEPKQIRPGENVTMVDGKVQVSGAVAVMAINEKLLQMLMQKNPDMSFGLQESLPLRGTYANAVPLGPLMELGVNDAPSVFTAERASQSVDYWRNAAQSILTDPEAAGSETTLKVYSHDINSTANLLASGGFNSDAEQAYRLSTQLWPANPDAVGGLANVLAQTGRTDEARRLLDTFAQDHPDQRAALEKMTVTFRWTPPDE